MSTTYKHLVIVHGIGDQAPNETSINFMNNFFRALPTGKGYKLRVYNLITTVDPPEAKVKTFRPAYATYQQPNGNNCVIGFSEVYWQDITNKVLKKFDKQTPIPMFVWAHSINTRIMGKHYYMVRDAISNLESLLGIVDNLAVILKRVALFMRVLNRFVGDVQQYVESTDIRDEVDARFASVLEQVQNDANAIAAQGELNEALSAPEIYVVAHSEGTVVSYSSLVRAAINGVSWLDNVKALVTLGSPLDKHFAIWRTRFIKSHDQLSQRGERIPWFNFWDISDPVGYGLKALTSGEAAKDSESVGYTDAEKLFDLKYDRGVARYWVPGKAHVDYWADSAIHEQIIHQAMDLGTTRGTAPNVTDVRSRPGLERIQPVGAWAGYILGRAATVAFLLYFLTRLAGPLPDWKLFSGFLSPDPKRFSDWLTCAVTVYAPLVVCKLLWEAYKKGGKFWLWVRGGIFAVWLCILGAAAYTLHKPETMLSTKDVVGYGTGLVVTILVWQLHTRVHKGLVQMWRYTKDKDSSALPYWRKPEDSGQDQAYRAAAAAK
jgi:hypothetical protein